MHVLRSAQVKARNAALEGANDGDEGARGFFNFSLTPLVRAELGAQSSSDACL